MSQAALAEAAGVKQQLISQIENGKNVTTKKLPDIARALNCEVYDLDPNYRLESVQGGDELLGKFNQILKGDDEDQLRQLDDYLDYLLSKRRQSEDSN